jgi:hypothetical protein
VKKYSSSTDVPAEIIQMWESAWAMQPTRENPFEVDLTSRRELVNFRQLMYTARKKLIEDNYPGAQNIAKLTIVELDELKLGIILPGWLLAIRKSLEKAGVEVPPLPEVQKNGEDATIEPDPGLHQRETLQKLFGGEKHGPGKSE